MELLNPANLNYWQQILKNKYDIAMLKETSTHFTYVVGHATSIDNMPFDSDNIEINKNDFRGYIINRVINDDNPNYTLNVIYNSQNYETDMFIFFGTVNGLYLICFPVYNNETILYVGKWNGVTYEYCNQITKDLADSIQKLTETLSNYQTKLNFDVTPTLGSNNPVTSDGIKKAINEHQGQSGDTLPSIAQIDEWSNDNLTTTLFRCSGTIHRKDFKIGYKNGIISIYGKFILEITSRTNDNPGITINLPSEWSWPSPGYKDFSIGSAYKVSTPYDASQVTAVRPYTLTLDFVAHSLTIGMVESYTNVPNNSIYVINIPLTYIKL